MKTIIENRASFILYNIIVSNELDKGLILLPSNICPIVPATLMKSNSNFVFFDINSTSFLPDENTLIEIISNKKNISAILYNHTFGIQDNPEQIFEQIKSINNNIFIIDDSCLSKPFIKPKQTYADVTLLSTGYSKYVDLSYGGFAFIKDTVKYECNILPFEEKYHDELVDNFNEALTTNSKFIYKNTNWLNSTASKINKEDYFNKIDSKLLIVEEHKTKLNNIYINSIDKKFHLGEKYNTWRFNILVSNKQYVLNKIFENKLFASSHYQSLVGIFGSGEGENSEKLHSKIINLFNDFRFTEEKAFLISEIVNKYAK